MLNMVLSLLKKNLTTSIELNFNIFQVIFIYIYIYFYVLTDSITANRITIASPKLPAVTFLTEMTAEPAPGNAFKL